MTTNTTNTTQKPKLMTIKILPDTHRDLMHLKADTGKPIYKLIAALVQANKAQAEQEMQK